MPGGRPTKYKEEYCEVFINEMREGGFIETFCDKIEIHVSTFYEWCKVHDKFSEAVKIGKTASKSIFLKDVRAAAFDTETHKVNNGLIALLASNCHGMYTKKDPEDKSGNDTPPPAKIIIEIDDGSKSKGQ